MKKTKVMNVSLGGIAITVVSALVACSGSPTTDPNRTSDQAYTVGGYGGIAPPAPAPTNCLNLIECGGDVVQCDVTPGSYVVRSWNEYTHQITTYWDDVGTTDQSGQGSMWAPGQTWLQMCSVYPSEYQTIGNCAPFAKQEYGDNGGCGPTPSGPNVF